MRKLASALQVFALAFVLACGNRSSEEPAPLEDDPNASGNGGGFGENNGGGGNTNRPGECAEDTKDVFVISAENSFYQFHPPDLSFKNLGLLRCPTGGATPTSMAVDRQGKAWVRHTDGTIWKVDTKTLKCEGTAFAPPSSGDFFQFGMGFATESKGGSAESLFVSDSAGAGLGRVNTDTYALTPVGPYTGDLAGKPAELTGTGDGKLYGFFVTAPAQIAEISRGTGTIVTSTELPGVYAGNAWAFSFYGGDFYVYTSSEGSGGLPPAAGNGGSDVTRFSPKDGKVELVKPKIGFKIVGAGVSTCAPTGPTPR